MTNYEKIKAMSVEEMADVVGYEGLYKVDRNGNIFSLYKKRFLKPAPTKGYLTVELFKNGIGKTTRIHKIVAKAYIPNPNNRREVNHIDGNKLNNTVENLEWCTHGENMKHAWDMGLNRGNVLGINGWRRREEEE